MKAAVGSFLIFISLTGISISQSGWFQINSPTNKYIYSAYFFDINTGFIGVDSGKIYRTTSGGNDWTLINLLSVKPMGKIIFENSNTGFVMSYHFYTNGALFKTTNSG